MSDHEYQLTLSASQLDCLMRSLSQSIESRIDAEQPSNVPDFLSSSAKFEYALLHQISSGIGNYDIYQDLLSKVKSIALQQSNHYKTTVGYDLLDFDTTHCLGMKFGTFLKYVFRMGKKDPPDKEVRKALDYLFRVPHDERAYRSECRMKFKTELTTLLNDFKVRSQMESSKYLAFVENITKIFYNDPNCEHLCIEVAQDLLSISYFNKMTVAQKEELIKFYSE